MQEVYYTSEIAYKRIEDPLPLPTHCHACSSPEIRLTTNDIIYGQKHGKWPLVWYCINCEAAVSCHPQTEVPVGFMACRETRKMRKRVHQHFDPLWKRKGGMSRGAAYKWLARQMEMDPRICHISYFDQDLCKKAIKILTKFREGKYNAI